MLAIARFNDVSVSPCQPKIKIKNNYLWERPSEIEIKVTPGPRPSKDVTIEPFIKYTDWINPTPYYPVS